MNFFMKQATLLLICVLFNVEMNAAQDLPETNTASDILEQKLANMPAADAARLREYLRNIAADSNWDWKQPINFWGNVVDESNAPVAGASVHFSWNDLSADGTSTSSTNSDANGLFSLTGKH